MIYIVLATLAITPPENQPLGKFLREWGIIARKEIVVTESSKIGDRQYAGWEYVLRVSKKAVIGRARKTFTNASHWNLVFTDENYPYLFQAVHHSGAVSDWQVESLFSFKGSEGYRSTTSVWFFDIAHPIHSHKKAISHSHQGVQSTFAYSLNGNLTNMSVGNALTTFSNDFENRANWLSPAPTSPLTALRNR